MSLFTRSCAHCPSPARLLVWTVVSLFCLLAWDASGQDIQVARLFASASGFALRDHWFLVRVLHEGARNTAWLVMLALAVAIWWPFGVLRQMERGQRVQLVASTLLAVLLINVLKYASTTSCPWDLTEFGGVAQHISHWALGMADGGVGHCFPAGHASAGFAFVSGFFVLRQHQPRAARWWLVAALAAGLVLGGAQQLRGAHFVSHTLWTGWLCWTINWLCDAGVRRFTPTSTVISLGKIETKLQKENYECERSNH